MFKPISINDVKRDIVEHMLCAEANVQVGRRRLTLMRDFGRNREYFKIEVRRKNKPETVDYANTLEEAVQIYNES